MLSLAILLLKILAAPDKDFHEFHYAALTAKQEAQYNWTVLDSFNIFLSSYGFLVNFYPIYDKLKPELRGPSNARLAVCLALSFICVTYIAFSYLSIEYFGTQHIDQDIFTNFAREGGWLSMIIIFWFMLISLCSFPFNFHPLKLCVLNFLQEIRTGAISAELEDAFKMSAGNSISVSRKPIEDTASDSQHSSVVLGLLIAIAGVALYVTDLTLVFGVVGAFGEALVNFILPGGFLVATARQLWHLDPQNRDEYARQILAGSIVCAFGTFYFFVSNYNTYKKLVAGGPPMAEPSSFGSEA